MIRSLALVALLVTAACVTTVQPTPSPSPTLTAPLQGVDMTDVLLRTALPANDPFVLTRQLRGRDGTPGPEQPVRSTPLDRQVGDRDDFFFYNERTKSNERLTAVVRHRTDHAYWYVQTGVTVDPARLVQTALEFEGRIYPTVQRLYGQEWTPGIDSDPRLTILIARIPDVGGYFSAADELPKWVNPFSNEREMIYVNVDGAPVGSPFLISTLAHEFAHMIEFAKRKPSAVWFNEGQAQIAELATVAQPSGTIVQFLREPDTQLTDWHDTAAESGANYGHAFLFLQYLAERFGGPPLVRALMERGVMTPADLDAALRERGAGLEDAYLDFVGAVGLGDQPDAPSPYRFEAVRLPSGTRASRERLELDERRRASVHQYAARFFELPAGAISVDLAGATQVRLLPTEPHSGQWLWWSNRGDLADTTLTRRIDLRGVDRATLTFWTWFEIEQNFDYAYVVASVDGGRTWTTLRTGSSTDEDPNGTNLGNGITGRSGGSASPRWIEERVDLTPFARKDVLVRFQYVTDQALNKDGFAVDDLAVPELNWKDDAESAADWEARGFVRSSNFVRQRFAVQVLSFGDRAAVPRARTGADGVLHLEAPVGDRGGLLAITAFAVHTTLAGTFEVTVRRR